MRKDFPVSPALWGQHGTVGVQKTWWLPNRRGGWTDMGDSFLHTLASLWFINTTKGATQAAFDKIELMNWCFHTRIQQNKSLTEVFLLLHTWIPSNSCFLGNIWCHAQKVTPVHTSTTSLPYTVMLRTSTSKTHKLSAKASRSDHGIRNQTLPGKQRCCHGNWLNWR